MERKEMIQAIYEKVADKTLSFGCMIKIWNSNVSYIVLWNPYKNNDDLWYWVHKEPVYWECLYWDISSHRNDIEIIWHKVMLWDFLDYIEKIKDKKQLESTEYYAWLYDYICIKWEHKRKPIEEQSNECIKYVFDLINK